jgi:predicted transcriptional regulator
MMNLSNRIGRQIIAMVSCAKNQRLSSYDVECRIASKLGVSISTVKEVLKDLIRRNRLVLTYRQGRNFVEIPVHEEYEAASPMKVIVDANGESWICDSDVDQSKDLSTQGC